MNTTQITTETIARAAGLTSGWDDTPAETVDVEVTYLTGIVASWAMTDKPLLAAITLADGEQVTIVPRDQIGRDLDALVGRTIRVQVVTMHDGIRWAAPDAGWAADIQSLSVVD